MLDELSEQIAQLRHGNAMHLFARGRTREIRVVARQDYGDLLSNLQRAVDRDV